MNTLLLDSASFPWWGLVLTSVVVLLVTPLLASLALRSGWIDRCAPDERVRKPRRAPVAPVGGLAIAIGIAIGGWTGMAEQRVALPYVALAAALVLGLIDDGRTGGLGVGAKLAGQIAVGALLGWELGEGPFERVSWCLWSLVGMNALNTFDNSDGAAGAVAGVGLASQPLAAVAVLGFLPWNVLRQRASDVPRAYLGDAGSHLLGVLLVLDPLGRLALTLPLLDLARLAVLRPRSGSVPWHGDRRHLAHRLQARGLGAPAVAALLALLSAPILGAGLGWYSPLVALGGIVFGFLLAVVLTPPVAGDGSLLRRDRTLDLGS